MKLALTIEPAAQADILEAANWYDDQRAGLGNDFLMCIADAIADLEESASRFPPYYRDFRRFLVDRFPYKVFYRLIDDDVVVFRILHTSRDHARELDG